MAMCVPTERARLNYHRPSHPNNEQILSLIDGKYERVTICKMFIPAKF